MRLIETTHLETWAGSTPARSRFPYLVKSLICAVIQPEKLRMPSGDAGGLSGFDGVLLNREESRFVPIGQSVWELGTGEAIKAKADGDYEKRSRGDISGSILGNLEERLDRSKTKFVFVTPRVWSDKDAWVSSRKAEGIWEDVVAIDGVDLQDWLETALAVNLQFSAELGLVPEEGLQTPEQAWEEWSHLTDPPISEELAVAGREDQEKDLVGRLVAPPGTFTVRGDSPREAWGFVLGVLQRISEEELRQSLYARTVVVKNEEVAGRLRNLANLIIVLKQTRGQVSGVLSSKGSHVVVPEGNDPHSERNVVVLARPTHGQFSSALVRMGLPEDEADRETRACGRSITTLQRLRAHSNFERPRWSQVDQATQLLPALLAGRWNRQSEADREIIRQLAGAEDYAHVEGQLQPFLLVDEPPLRLIGEMWTLTAPADAFQLVARHLTPTNLDLFKSAFQDVFGGIDPKVEIPVDEWIYHDIKGEQGHSGWLRSGMAESLLLIAERGADARLICVQSPRTYADEVLRGLPGLNDDWRVLASLRDQYALLMEAAPVPLLDGLEHLLKARPDDVRCLFVEGKGLGGGHLHTGLLWGLETLAWSPEYLPRVALILARLARLDPGLRVYNSPINSLSDIFLWWHLGTNAPSEQRLAVIDSILSQEPEVGWVLLSRLLPDARHSISNGTAKPHWRDFGDPPEDTRSRLGQMSYVSGVVDRALDRVGQHPERWSAILGSLRGFSAAQIEKTLSLLGAIAQVETAVQAKAGLWEILRDFTHRHRSFQDADWALTADVLGQLETILPLLAPGDPVEQSRWLFDDWLPDLPSSGEDTERHQGQVEELRKQAILDILQAQGTQGLVKLGTTCGYPGFVASTTVPLLPDLSAVHSFVEQAISAGDAGVFLAGQISGNALQLHGEAWRDLVHREAQAGTWPPAVVATLLMWWPDGRATWEDTVALGEEVALEYWRRKRVFIIDGTPEDRTYQIDQLIKVGRAAEAFDRIATRGKDVPSDVLLRLFDATFNELGKAQTAEEVRRLRIDSHDVRRFLGQLRQRAEVPREEVARREYRALPLLDARNAQGLTLHEFLAEDPEFFISVLCDVFLPAHQDKNEKPELTPEERARAQFAYSLLEGMSRVPGQLEGNQLDEEELMRWISAVREKAVAVDRAVIADQKVGQILAHAPEDPSDGSWPHQVVRNVIERLASTDIERGLSVERFNMRGGSVRSMYEGGVQERALAAQYRTWKEASRNNWPRMAQVLDGIAEYWEEHARREDTEVEQLKAS